MDDRGGNRKQLERRGREQPVPAVFQPIKTRQNQTSPRFSFVFLFSFPLPVPTQFDRHFSEFYRVYRV